MRYDNIHKGKFLSRPNRFIANVEIDGKAEVCHVEDIVGEVGVVVGVGAAHIVVLVAALLHELLELRHDGVIAAVACVVLAEAVMDFPAAIAVLHDIVALLVAEVDDVGVDEHAVGGHGEAEVLVVDLLLLAAVGHQLFHHVEVHQRLAAEEIDLEVAAGAGVLDEEVHSPLAHLEAHQGAVALIAALRGEAEGAVETDETTEEAETEVTSEINETAETEGVTEINAATETEAVTENRDSSEESEALGETIAMPVITEDTEEQSSENFVPDAEKDETDVKSENSFSIIKICLS